MSTITVKIPGGLSSSSKMSKKGWKCWAKILTSVDTPAKSGFSFHGEFASIGATVECNLGDVLLHVDDSSSSGIAVVMANAKGEGWLSWQDSTSDGKWAGVLAKTAREFLAIDPDERVRRVAGQIADESDESRLARGAKALSAEGRDYYTRLAGRSIQPATHETPVEADVEPTEPHADADPSGDNPLIAGLADLLRQAIAAERDRLVGRQRAGQDSSRQSIIDRMGEQYRQVYQVAIDSGLDRIPGQEVARVLRSNLATAIGPTVA